MKLINQVEPILQLLNSPHIGQFLNFEEGGTIPKGEIEHFAIVHLQNPEEVNKGFEIKRKTKKTTVESESTEEVEEDVVTMSESETLSLIRRLRKINCPSMTTLGDNGWFICPIYSGMTELRPLSYKKLPAKKGYKLTILKVSIGNVSGLFTKDNFSEWELNSILQLNMHFDSHPYGFKAMSVFIHKKDDINTKLMRNAVNRLETTQRTRIKLGNILIDEVISLVGQEAYINNKQNLAKANKSKASVTEYDTADVKIIKYVEKAYKRIHKTAEKMSIKTPIRRHDSFVTVMDRIKTEEQEEHKQRADEWLKDILADPIKLEEWKKSYKQSKIDEGEDEESIVVPSVPSIDDALNETYQLGANDYISSFITYINVQSYMNSIKSEKDAELVVNERVHQSYLWEYIDGIKGCGEITAAYILSDIDFRSTVHSSSVIRYLGLDNITTIANREDTPVSEEQLPLIIRFLFHNYELVKNREANEESDDFGELPPLSEETFYRYSSELIEDWSEFKAIARVYNTPGIKDKDYHTIKDLDPDFRELVQKVWEHADIVEYVGPGGRMIPTIKKHARSKKDTVLTTFLDKNGNISTKKSLGYNTKLKARIIEIMFGSMMKAKNEYYYGELYLGYRERLAQRYLAKGEDPELHKNHIHMQARRFAVQIFIEHLWEWVRQKKGWPLNGGSYYEAKLRGTHNHGLANNSPLNK